MGSQDQNGVIMITFSKNKAFYDYDSLLIGNVSGKLKTTEIREKRKRNVNKRGRTKF